MKIRTQITLVAIMAATTMTTAFAQGTGADTYKAKCPDVPRGGQYRPTRP